MSVMHFNLSVVDPGAIKRGEEVFKGA